MSPTTSFALGMLFLGIAIGLLTARLIARDTRNRAHQAPRCRPRRYAFVFHGPNGYSLTTERFFMDLLKKQSVDFSVVPVDSDEQAAAIDGPVRVTSSDESVCTVTQTTSTTWRADYVGPGTAVIQIGGDADLGPDELLISGTGEIRCLPGQAVGFKLAFGAPYTTPEPAPDA